MRKAGIGGPVGFETTQTRLSGTFSRHVKRDHANICSHAAKDIAAMTVSRVALQIPIFTLSKTVIP